MAERTGKRSHCLGHRGTCARRPVIWRLAVLYGEGASEVATAAELADTEERRYPDGDPKPENAEKVDDLP